MFFALSKIVGLFLDPLLWIVVIAVAGGCLSYSKPKGMWGRRLLLLAIAGLVVFSNPILFRAAFRSWEIAPVSSSSLDQSYELAIVLGGYSNPALSDQEKLVFGSDPNRLTDAIRLYKNGQVKKLLLTGGSAAFFSEGKSETPLAAAYLREIGIPEEALLSEPESRNTHENAMYSAKLLEEIKTKEPLLLITSAVHMRRARACFRKQGIEVDCFSTDQRAPENVHLGFRDLLPDSWVLAQWEFLIREWVGLLAYKLSGKA